MIASENGLNVAKVPLAALAASRRQAMAGAVAFGIMGMIPRQARAVEDDGISHAAEAIHQEPVFKATRKQVYEALTDEKKFDQVARLSEAMQTMAAAEKPTEISRDVGGPFTLFGGYIVGRHIELVSDARIVQAWRSQAWKPGEYSIVRFDLAEEGSGTRILFDHRGFPQGTAQHLAAGWKANYWEPLEKYLLAK